MARGLIIYPLEFSNIFESKKQQSTPKITKNDSISLLHFRLFFSHKKAEKAKQGKEQSDLEIGLPYFDNSKIKDKKPIV
jgi:hypothetical protein